jgi:hypothetical protein
MFPRGVAEDFAFRIVNVGALAEARFRNTLERGVLVSASTSSASSTGDDGS